jgi:uncharacterized membrane protein
MKICIFHDYSPMNWSVNDPSLPCIFFSSDMDPQHNLFIDWLSFGFVMSYVVFILVFNALFMFLKHKNRIESSFKNWYLILSSIASFNHIAGIFLTYGFFWPHLDLTKPCSLWNFWLQWFLGFSIWMGILCTRIFLVAQSAIHRLNVQDEKMRLLQRIAVFVGVILIIGIIGIVAEATSAFYINDHGKCTTSIWTKLLILGWMVTVILFLVIFAYLTKHHGHISSDSHLVSLELKVVKVTWPILVACILLNFSGLTSYAIIRFTFLMLIIVMYTWSAIVFYVSQIIVYYFSNVSCMMALIEYFDIYIPTTYATIGSNIINDSIMPPQRTTIDESEHFDKYTSVPDIFLQDGTSTSADILLPPSSSSSSHVIPILNDDLEEINMESASGRNKMINIIKTSNEAFDSFLEALSNQCAEECVITNKEKMVSINYYDVGKTCVITIEVPLDDMIKFINKIRDLLKQYAYSGQMTKAMFIKMLRSIFSECINTSVEEEISIDVGDELRKKLAPLEEYPEIADIIFNFTTEPDPESQFDSIYEKITEFYKSMKDHIIETFFSFWYQSKGKTNLIESQKQKKQAVAILQGNTSSLF